MPLIPKAFAALLALSLIACASRPPAAPGQASTPAPTPIPTPSAPVLLVSLDGFRADYLELGITPNLARLAATGVRAEWMEPAYPTLTFPNHYTIVTGLHPDRHGIVHNTMRDIDLGRFSLGNREAVGDGRWWGGEPIWVGAENAGLATATLSWPGSEAPVQGVQPTRWRPFDASLAIDARVDIVLGWLAEPAATRPAFATLYFEHLDSAAHPHGPDSPEAHAAIARLDAAIGRLLDGLGELGQRGAVNLVVVSDHGMAAVAPGHTVALEDLVDPADATAVTYGQSLGFAPLPGRSEAAEAQLLGAHQRYDCWRKAELPARWHYGQHPRVPPIVCQMHEGWDARPRASIKRRAQVGTRGSHGFDPALASMRALFIAHGPAFRRGVVLPAFDNVDVYPLLARLLGIEPEPHDGDDDALAALRDEAPG
ncbi:alkaline phosphatase family protein [Lysobacter sp. D1-1-M9]|uniref:alkaline phosphatase family protein n=1 Tax=Novilysobacter longmucuonensis TaxID=3098603 RepID=UPI002FC8236B